MAGGVLRRWPLVVLVTGFVVASAVPAGAQETTTTSAPPETTTTTTSPPETTTTTTEPSDEPVEPGVDERDPIWAATATISCGTSDDTVLVVALEATVREGQDALFYWGPRGEGRLNQLAEGDEIPASAHLFWSVRFVELGPWPVDVVDACVRNESPADVAPVAAPAAPAAPAAQTTLPMTGPGALGLVAVAGAALLTAGVVLGRLARPRD